MDTLVGDGPFDESDAVGAVEILAVNAPGGRKYRGFWKEVGLLGRLAKASLTGEYELSAPKMAALVTGLVYVVSPIDAIPDFIPIIGWTDDLGVIASVTALLSYELLEFREWELVNAAS